MASRPAANDLSGTYANLKANRQNVRRSAEQTIRNFLEADVAGRPNPPNLSTDEISILVPLQKQPSNSEDESEHEKFTKLIDDTKDFIHLYSLMFQKSMPQQYNQAVAELARGSNQRGNNTAPAYPDIKYNCFSHMRITKNKKMSEEQDGQPIAESVQIHNGRGSWMLITGLGPGGMRVAIPGFKVLSQWSDENSRDAAMLAELGLILRPNLWIGALSWEEKIYIEFFLPYLEGDDVSMDRILSNGWSGFCFMSEVFE